MEKFNSKRDVTKKIDGATHEISPRKETEQQKDKLPIKEIGEKEVTICNPFTLHHFPKRPRPSNLPRLAVPGMVVPIKKLTKQFGLNQTSPVSEAAIWQGDTLETLGLDPQKMDIVQLNELIQENQKNLAAIQEQQHIAKIAAREKERIEAQEKAKEQMRREILAEQSSTNNH